MDMLQSILGAKSNRSFQDLKGKVATDAVAQVASGFIRTFIAERASNNMGVVGMIKKKIQGGQ